MAQWLASKFRGLTTKSNDHHQHHAHNGNAHSPRNGNTFSRSSNISSSQVARLAGSPSTPSRQNGSTFGRFSPITGNRQSSLKRAQNGGSSGFPMTSSPKLPIKSKFFSSDPRLEVFKQHWNQIKTIIHGSRISTFSHNWDTQRDVFYHYNRRSEPTVNYNAQADEVSAFAELLEKSVCLLVDEERSLRADDHASGRTDQTQNVGPILEYAIREDFFDLLTSWSRQPTNPLQLSIIIELLKMYETIMNEGQLSVLHQRPIIANLVKLLRLRLQPDALCSSHLDELDMHIVTLVNVLCARIQREEPILNLLFACSAHEQEGPLKLLIFALLTHYIYRDDVLGTQAKDALLLLLSLTITSDQVAEYVYDQSNFCICLVSGLSALYSELPMRIPEKFQDKYQGQWTRLKMDDLKNDKDREFSTLFSFIRTLEFCNSVVSVSCNKVRNQFIEYFYSGFLVNVLAPSLVQSNPREIIATTAYLELVLRVITSQDLIWSFLRLLVCNHMNQDDYSNSRAVDGTTYLYDGIVLIEIFIGRLASQNQYIAITTLALFSTLISLNCEDLMVQIVFQYLVPRNHIVRKYMGESDEAWALHKSSLWFLEQMPKCVRPERMDNKISDIFKPLTGENATMSPDMDLVMPPLDQMPEDCVAVSDYDVNMDLSVTISMRMGFIDCSLERMMQHILPLVNSTTGRLNTFVQYERSSFLAIRECEQRCRAWTTPYNWSEPFDDIVITMYNTQPSPVKGHALHARRPEELSGQSEPMTPRATNPTTIPRLEIPSEMVDDDLLLTTEFDKSPRDDNSTDLNSSHLSQTSPRQPQPPQPRDIDSPEPLELSNLHDQDTKDEDFFDSIDIDAFPDTANTMAVIDDKTPLDCYVNELDRIKSKHGIERDRMNSQASATSLPESDKKLASASPVRRRPAPVRLDSFSDEDTSSKQLRSALKNSNNVLSLMGSHENRRIGSVTSSEDLQFQSDADDFIEDDWLDTSHHNTPQMRFGRTGSQSSGRFGSFRKKTGNMDSKAGSSISGGNNASSAYVGPFLGMILSRLEQIQSKSIQENLLLCEVISRLCTYSQPLLRSFLLDTALPLQPSIQNLAQVISSVRRRIDDVINNGETLLNSNNSSRPKGSTIRTLNNTRNGSGDGTSSPELSPVDILVQRAQRYMFGQVYDTRTNLEKKPNVPGDRSGSDSGQGGHSPARSASQHKNKFEPQERHRRLTTGPFQQNMYFGAQQRRIRNSVFAAVILGELCQELAAYAEQHAILALKMK